MTEQNDNKDGVGTAKDKVVIVPTGAGSAALLAAFAKSPAVIVSPESGLEKPKGNQGDLSAAHIAETPSAITMRDRIAAFMSLDLKMSPMLVPPLLPNLERPMFVGEPCPPVIAPIGYAALHHMSLGTRFRAPLMTDKVETGTQQADVQNIPAGPTPPNKG